MQLSSPHPDRKKAGPVVLASHEYAPFRGGAATYVREVAAAAGRLGVPVEVGTVDYAGRNLPADASADDASRSVETVRLASNGRLTPGGLLSLAWGFWRRRRDLRDRPVVLLSVGAQMAFFLLDGVGQRPGGEVTCLFHGSEVLRFQRNPFWRWLACRFYRKNRTLAATTWYVADLLRASSLVPDGAEITLAPCALPEAFRADAEAKVRGEGSDPRELRVLTVARLHPRKGQLDVARALVLLPEEVRTRVVYQMVGVGDETYRCEVAAVCQAGGVAHQFLGALDDRVLGEIYARATMYAQASRALAQSVEGFGLTFLEAGIYGCPAAAWRSGGVAEAVRDGETGLLVEEGDVTGLALAIQKLLVEPATRRALGGKAKEFAQQLTWERAAQNLCPPS